MRTLETFFYPVLKSLYFGKQLLRYLMVFLSAFRLLWVLLSRVWGGWKFVAELMKTKTGFITDNEGNVLPATTLFWFAWQAFYPDTAVF